MSVEVQNRSVSIIEFGTFQMNPVLEVYRGEVDFTFTEANKPTYFSVYLDADSSETKLIYNKTNDRYEFNNVESSFSIYKDSGSSTYNKLTVRANDDLSGHINLVAYYKSAVKINGYYLRDQETVELLSALSGNVSDLITRVANDEDKLIEVKELFSTNSETYYYEGQQLNLSESFADYQFLIVHGTSYGSENSENHKYTNVFLKANGELFVSDRFIDTLTYDDIMNSMVLTPNAERTRLNLTGSFKYVWDGLNGRPVVSEFSTTTISVLPMTVTKIIGVKVNIES